MTGTITQIQHLYKFMARTAKAKSKALRLLMICTVLYIIVRIRETIRCRQLLIIILKNRNAIILMDQYTAVM